MDKPKCPFCDHAMEPHASSMDAYFRTYICEECHAELRQVLVRRPEEKAETVQVTTPTFNGCPDCQEADLHCFSCDDPVCPKHIRTVEKYGNVFTPELSSLLLERYGNHIYCPLCFKNVFDRFAHEVKAPKTKRPQFFNMPVILFLLAVVLIIVLGLQKCGMD